MKKLIIALGCVAAIGVNTAMAKEWKEIRLAVDVPYEPFEYKAPDGSLTGFEIDLGNEVCKEIKAKCEWVVQAWDGIIPGLLARKYDVIFSSMSITEDRAKKVLFSEPYYNTPSAWFAKKGLNIDVNDKAQLKGKIVGVQRGTLQDNYVTENLEDVVEIKRYTTADDLVLDLQGGRLDLVFLDYPVGEQTILNNADFETKGEPVKLGNGVGAAFRKRDKDLAAKFNAALRKIKADGRYDAIMKKYFKYDVKM
ncbi:transporter substrate-binding domain-containing protein [Hahella sp. SMD15-11]|uniref:Transporter substrate-binding domain-containing protein n=1 Tax=Thermohahella caldifontis TaxID=3142973 RepID=A0AB39UWD7_9GAMM